MDRRLIGELHDLRREGLIDAHPESDRRRRLHARIDLPEGDLYRVARDHRPLGALHRAGHQRRVRGDGADQRDAHRRGVAAVSDLDLVEQLIAGRRLGVAAGVVVNLADDNTS